MKPNTNHFPTVLLIDDDKDDCHFFEEAVADISPFMNTICLKDASKLLEVLEKTQPSLIVIDFHLPKENGVEWVQRLKAHPVFKAIPVVMWSTSGILHNVAAAYKAGVKYYFEKPWEIKVLAEKLKKIFRNYLSGLHTVMAFHHEENVLRA